MNLLYQYCFWIGLSALAFAYYFYPITSKLLARYAPRSVQSHADHTPSASVILVVYNEETRLTTRLENLFASDYPPDKLDVIVVDDGSSDGTKSLMASLASPRIRYIRFEDRAGKSARLNVAITTASADICILCDARQTFASDAIRRLARAFFDPSVGAVSGELFITASESTVGRGIDVYWSRERRLREAEAARHSTIGCTGAIYAIRTSLFTPLRSDTILDDVVIPMRIAERNYRILHDAGAHAFDSQPLEPKFEIRRKRRTLAGNFQMLFQYPTWLLPWGHPLWWRIIAHKYLRLLAPLFLCVVAVTSLLLCGEFIYRYATLLQLSAYSCGVAGMLTKSRAKFLAIPAAFMFLNGLALLAFWDFLCNRANARWETASSFTPNP